MDAAQQRSARQQAQALLPGLGFPSPAGVGDALPIVDDQGRLERWFVPVRAGATLLGFVVLSPTLTLLRSSAFAAPVPADDWLDPQRIRARAEEFSGEQAVEQPTLGHDGPADHLAWKVPMRSGTVMVAGAALWWQRPRDPGVTG